MLHADSQASAAKSLRQRLVGGGAWALVGKGGTLGLNFLTIALVTRFLAPDDAGEYAVAQSLVMAGAMIARLGLENTVVFLVSSALGSGSPGRARRAIRTVLVLGLSSAAIAWAALSLGGAAWIAHAAFGSPPIARIGGAIGLWTAAFAAQVLLSEAFRGFHAIREAVLFGGVVTGVLTVAGLAALHVRGPLSLPAAAWTATLSTLAGALVAGAALLWRTRRFGPMAPGEAYGYGAVLRGALPVLVSNVMTLVLSYVDLWVVRSHLPGQETAVYAVSARLVTLVGLSFVIANQVLPPVIGELWARGDKVLMERTLRGTALVVGLPAILVLGAFVLEGRLVLATAFGPFYERGALILAILSVGQMANVLTGATAFTLLMTGHGVVAMWIAGGAGAVATGASLVAVRWWGATGVACAVSAVVVVQQLVTLACVRRLVGVWTHASLTAAMTELRRLRS